MKIELPSVVSEPATTPARRDESVRLTTHMDIVPLGHGELSLRGGARELLTSGSSDRELGSAHVGARLAADRTLVDLSTSTAESQGRRIELAPLIGRAVGSGFRAAVDGLFGGVEEAGGPLQLLLDDLPAAALISGYAALYSGKMQIERKHLKGGLLRADICSGWRQDGTMLVTLRDSGHLPVPIGPPTTVLEPPDDPLAWHEIPALASGAMRRQRLIEVSRGPSSEAGSPTNLLDVYAMFRDTHVDDKGVESILHEYSVTARLDPATTQLSACAALPHVLPWTECPSAAASASRLDGKPLDEIRGFVARDMRGISTCTHLNDLLRSLSRVGGLLQHLS